MATDCDAAGHLPVEAHHAQVLLSYVLGYEESVIAFGIGLERQIHVGDRTVVKTS